MTTLRAHLWSERLQTSEQAVKVAKEAARDEYAALVTEASHELVSNRIVEELASIGSTEFIAVVLDDVRLRVNVAIVNAERANAERATVRGRTMSRTVWKWALPLEAEFSIEMPKGAEILTVQAQHLSASEAGVMWALVDPNAETEVRTFSLLGTGAQTSNDLGPYRGTFQLRGGRLVLHVFECDA